MLSLCKYQVRPVGFALSQCNVSVLQVDAALREGMTLTLQKANNAWNASTSHGKRGVSKRRCGWGQSQQNAPIYLQQLHGAPSASTSMLTAEPLRSFPLNLTPLVLKEKNAAHVIHLQRQRKNSLTVLFSPSTSEHPVRWYPGHQPGKVDTAEEPPRFWTMAMPARAVGQVSVWPVLNSTLFLLLSAIKIIKTIPMWYGPKRVFTEVNIQTQYLECLHRLTPEEALPGCRMKSGKKKAG